MKIYRIVCGFDNGCNGQSVEYYPWKYEAEAELQKAKDQHDISFSHITPEIQTIEFEGPITLELLCQLLNRETSPLSTN